MHRRNWTVALIGLLLFVSPLLFRTLVLGYNWRSYVGPELTVPDLAVTPVPTLVIALPVPPVPASGSIPIRGDVVVDFVHGQPSGVTESNLQSLATALSVTGLRFTYWEDNSVRGLDPNGRRTQLAEQLRTASALIIFDGWVDWQEEELLVVDNFVRDGGRLLFFSDPDFRGTQIGNISRVANRFGIVFNEGYLYDTLSNDENFIHIPLEMAEQAEAADLIYAYGSRSISGLIEPIVYGGADVHSSLQAGASHFPVIARGDGSQNRHYANVLAMGDFQLLTEPFVSRHANRQILDYVAGFLAGGSRAWPMDSFPDYLDRSIQLFVDSSLAMDWELLSNLAHLQDELATNGHQVAFAEQMPAVVAAEITTGTVPAILPPTDTLYFAQIGRDVLADSLVRQMGDSVVFRDGEVAELRLASGVRLRANETILLLRRRIRTHGQVLAVLGTSPGALNAAVSRLRDSYFDDCIQEADRLFCPNPEGAGYGDEESGSPLSVLIINDDSTQPGAVSYDLPLYLTTLRSQGYQPVQMSTAELDIISPGVLAGFDWIIWNSDFPGGGPKAADRETLWNFLLSGGSAVTVSGGDTGWGSPAGPPAELLAFSPTPAISTLRWGIPAYVELSVDSPPFLSPMFVADGGLRPIIVLQQASPSPNAGAPLMLAYPEIDGDEGYEPLMLIGMPLSWLPDGYGEVLIRNMAQWIVDSR